MSLMCNVACCGVVHDVSFIPCPLYSHQLCVYACVFMTAMHLMSILCNVSCGFLHNFVHCNPTLCVYVFGVCLVCVCSIYL